VLQRGFLSVPVIVGRSFARFFSGNKTQSKQSLVPVISQRGDGEAFTVASVCSCLGLKMKSGRGPYVPDLSVLFLCPAPIMDIVAIRRSTDEERNCIKRSQRCLTQKDRVVN